MKTVTYSKGNIRITGNSNVPTFRGIHNTVKAKCFMVLLDRRLQHLPGLTLSELASQTTGNYYSISVLLVRWIRWKYVGYTITPARRRYHILKRGQFWLDRHQDIMPLASLIAELEAQQAAVAAASKK